MKILLVEDNDSDIESFKRSVTMFNLKNEVNLDCVYTKSIEEADRAIDSTIDFAIVDLKLAEQGNEGNTVISHIKENWRILTYVFTGTPDNITDKEGILKVFTKGKDSHDDIFKELLLSSSSGVLEILNRTGELESLINDIFWKNIIPTLDSWAKHACNDFYDKHHLFRHTLSHLTERLEDHGSFYPEEMYIYPPHDHQVKTGDIVESLDGKNEMFIVLAPACDLIVRDCGNMKTESIQLCKVDQKGIAKSKAKLIGKQQVIIDELSQLDDEESKEKYRQAVLKQRDASEALKRIKSNNFSANLHFLPKTEFFAGGEINFRKVTSVRPKTFESEYKRLDIRVTRAFLKDIVSRFASYYARQGQPDFYSHLL